MSLQPFTQVTGKAAPMLAANIDTDVIMPKQFLKGIDRSGLDRGLFFDLRFLASGEPNPAFVLNQPAWQGACFMVVGPNFGCGSSREHAVWGLKQMGIRALIGSRFAGIFYDNCQRNGVLLITLAVDVQKDMALVVQGAHRMGIDVFVVEGSGSHFFFGLTQRCAPILRSPPAPSMAPG
jgi:3-isopropylmalate/(R)-2-methylmalate dehydratase small subunit